MYSRYRRAFQFLFFFLMFLIPVLNHYEFYGITGTFYALNVGGLGVADPSVILQAVFAAGELTLPLLTAAVFPLLLALLLGRVWCGWMCPYLLLSDACGWIRTRVLRRPAGATLVCPASFKANFWRFSFLVVGTAAAGALSIPLLNYVNAPGIVSTEAMILVKERSLSIEFGFIVLILAVEIVLAPRFWCRLFCPTGSVVSLFRLPFGLRVTNELKNPKAPCCAESHCSSVCPMGLKPFRESRDTLCVNCGLCVDACPHERLKFDGFREMG